MKEPKKVLIAARKAFKTKNYKESLRLYEYFFDHSMDEDESSYYGVRLSYCLDEWVELGKVYPKARNQLIKKKEESLKLLHKKLDPEKFNDFKSIASYLNMDDEVMDEFLHLHKINHKLAKKCVRFIWNKLVESKNWKMCQNYLGSPLKRLNVALDKFESSMEISKENPNYGGEEFNQQITSWLIEDVTNILQVLKNCNMKQEVLTLMRVFEEKIQNLGYPELSQTIVSKINK